VVKENREKCLLKHPFCCQFRAFYVSFLCWIVLSL